MNKNHSRNDSKVSKEPNGNRDNRNRYREPDYEFDAIIESEGVLDVMMDGYGFPKIFRLSLLIIA